MVDGIGHLVPKLKELYGDKVRFASYGRKRGLLQRFGGALAQYAIAAVEYIASLSDPADVSADSNRSAQLAAAWQRITQYEQTLSARLLSGLQGIPGLTVYGIRSLERLSERVPTVSFTIESTEPAELATRLAAEGIFVWGGNHYAQPVTEACDLEPGGTLRMGALHYTTLDEIDRATATVRRLVE